MRAIYAAAVALAVSALSCSDFGPAPYAGPSRRLAVGESTACALDSQGTVYCWGANTSRWEYGASPKELPSSDVPLTVPIPKLASLASGVGSHFCGIMPDSRGVCWGRGGFGQLGGGQLGDSGNPATTVRGVVHWRELSVGRLDTCGVADDGRGFCWGANQHGEIGVTFVSLEERTWSPIELDGGFRFMQVTPGWYHSCGITTDSTAYCWGGNDAGQLGLGTADLGNHQTAKRVAGNLKFVQLAVGGLHTCGLAADSTVACWGENRTGQLGNGTITSWYSPQGVSSNQRFVAIATSSGFTGGRNVPLPPLNIGDVAHTCALNATGAAYCWGWNGNGQLGDGTTTDRLTPVPVSGGLQFSTIGLGGAYSCGMLGSAVWCWGSNAVGQLGVSASSISASSVPLQVKAPFSVP